MKTQTPASVILSPLPLAPSLPLTAVTAMPMIVGPRSILDWKGTAKWTVYDEPGSVAGSAGRVRYDKGDVEFEVQWYDRDISGGEERRIFKRQTDLEDRPCALLLSSSPSPSP